GGARRIRAHITALPGDLLPGACLPVRQRISPGRASKPVRRGAVAIGRAAAMFRVVLPAVAGVGGAATRDVGAPVEIRVAVEPIVPVDSDVVMPPPGAPAPSAAPERTHGDANTERDGCPRSVIPGRWVGDRGIRIYRRAIHGDRVVRRNVDD